MVTSATRKTLTKRQREVFEFLKEQITSRGYGPTVREIGDHFDIKSPNGVMCHLKALEKKGLISRESNMSRAICLATTANQKFSLPCLGTAISGSAIQAAVSSDEHVDFQLLFSGSDRACLLIEGSDFQSQGIHDGDQVIVNRNGGTFPNSLVAALDSEHRVAFFRIDRSGSHPAPAMPGMQASSPRQILGTVVGIIRQFPEAAIPAETSPPTETF